MKKTLIATAFVAMGFLVASSFAAAQDAPPPTSGGKITLGALGVKDITSAKFEEYREVPKGISIPFANLFVRKDKFDFNLNAFNVRQSDQRYTGWLNTNWMGVSFDYNQTPHNMGNDGRTMFAENDPGVWTMSATLRQALQTANDSTASAGRTVAFYDQLLGPTFASTNSIDISSQRNRGSAELTFWDGRPFNLAVTYMRQDRSGYRGLSGGNVRGVVSGQYEVPQVLDDTVQDFGFRAAYNFAKGNVHGAFARNMYNNDAERMLVDNPFQAYDAISGTTGGPSRGLFSHAPDNEASTGSGGFLLKFGRQTRFSGEFAGASWTQDAAFLPYTINSVILTGTGQPANQVSSLQQASLGGKINTTTMNFDFSSRPIKGLGIRVGYRSYDLTNKTDRYVITGDLSGNPDRLWSATTVTADEPYGHVTANPYDNKTSRFHMSASFDIGDLTVEGGYHYTDITRTHREATSGSDTGYLVAAIYRNSDWLRFRIRYEDINRAAEGETVYGFQADEAERDTTRTALLVDLMPLSSLDLTFAYERKNHTFPNRPDRVQVTSGAPAPGAVPIPGTPSGLLDAKYDSFTAEANFTPNARTQVGGYYTYEKAASTNQWSTTTGANLNNLLTYAGSDKTDTFGLNASFQVVPDKWTFLLNLMRQKVDGLMDITAKETGSFYTPGRTTLIPPGQGGAADILDYDDTELTTVVAQLDYAVAKAWNISMGYWYEKYDFKDAFTAGNLLMPTSVYIFMKPDNGPYTANVVFAKLSYTF